MILRPLEIILHDFLPWHIFHGFRTNVDSTLQRKVATRYRPIGKTRNEHNYPQDFPIQKNMQASFQHIYSYRIAYIQIIKEKNSRC